MDNLKDGILSINPLSSESLQTLSNCFKKKEIPKSHYLATVGFVSTNIYFVAKGILREYYIQDNEDKNDSEKEITTHFVGDGNFHFITKSYLLNEPSLRYVHALQESEIYLINKSTLENLIETNFEISKWVKKLYENKMIALELGLRTVRQNSLSDSYNQFLNMYSKLSNKIPDKYIASYLNKNASSVSRIKGIFAKKK